MFLDFRILLIFTILELYYFLYGQYFSFKDSKILSIWNILYEVKLYVGKKILYEAV